MRFVVMGFGYDASVVTLVWTTAYGTRTQEIDVGTSACPDITISRNRNSITMTSTTCDSHGSTHIVASDGDGRTYSSTLEHALMT